MALIKCENLTLGYEGRPVVTGLNFEVNEGDYVCIVGENGSGKSTLMKAILGLVQPLSGQIIFGDGLTQNQVGYLPQLTDNQRDFPATVREVVYSGCIAGMGRRPFFGRREKEIAKNAMERMGILDLAKRSYRDLSGGQQQRVLLARALCAARKILLLDEPVSGLDPKATIEMYDAIDRLNAEGVAILMISHDILAATIKASHILHLGRETFFGTTAEYEASRTGREFMAAP
ncbi:MAG: metal ABC transporter ATP-binding protein [Lachnospiraceae bacterium]|nr:metal ABC transporter ATP-binding protein [Lachnospiraceae bacterium]